MEKKGDKIKCKGKKESKQANKKAENYVKTGKKISPASHTQHLLGGGEINPKC